MESIHALKLWRRVKQISENQHKYGDLRRKPEREKLRRGRERFHYNNGDYNGNSLVS